MVSELCRIEAELRGVGLRRFAVTTRFPVLTRTYGRLRNVRGIVVPELDMVDVCDDGTTIGLAVVSSPEFAANTVDFFRII